MSLYDDASLVMIPSAIEDGKLYNVKPKPIPISGELITNGTFDTDSDWNLTGATISGGKVNVNSSSPVYIIQNNVATVGKLYKVELTVSNYVQGDLRLRYPFTISESEFTGNGTYVFYGTAEDARFELQGRFSGQTYNYSIDNVSVKEFTENVVAPYSGTGSLLLEPQSTNLVTYSEEAIGKENTEVIHRTLGKIL